MAQTMTGQRGNRIAETRVGLLGLSVLLAVSAGTAAQSTIAGESLTDTSIDGPAKRDRLGTQCLSSFRGG
jgi:hypothetical protein